MNAPQLRSCDFLVGPSPPLVIGLPYDHPTQVLPFPREAVSQLDYNSRLRLALCFFRLKTMVEGASGEMAAGGGGASEPQHATDSGKQMAIVKRKFASDTKPPLFQPGMLQDLMSEVCMCITLCVTYVFLCVYCDRVLVRVCGIICKVSLISLLLCYALYCGV